MDHDWLAFTAPNGDQGYQCQRCRLTTGRIPVPASITCPPKLIPTLAELLDKVHREQAAAAATAVGADTRRRSAGSSRSAPCYTCQRRTATLATPPSS